jgi:cation-transporting ATPase 13A2
MRNNLKDITSKVINELKKCDVNVMMATGDNLLTAFSVAKKCNILNDK